MSLLTYNGVTLQLVKTNVIQKTPRYSDDKTEYMWTDFIIDIVCIYNPAATSYSATGTFAPGNLPMTTDAGIRAALAQPRRPLLFQEGGISILNIPSTQADGSALDCENGPIPQVNDIVRIGSSRIFWVSFVVKASVIECPSGGFITAIASSRYMRQESIDKDFLSTLTTSGITYFRSNVLSQLAAGQNVADDYRGFIIPQPLLGYKREAVNFAIDSSGIAIRWSTTDVEQKQELGAQAAPGTAASVGITQMGCTYHSGAMTGGPMGMVSNGSVCSVNVWAQGIRGIDRYGAMAFIVGVAYQKLQNVAPIGIVTGGTVSEDIFNNRVEMSITYTVLDDQDGFPDLTVPIQNVVGNQIALPSLPNNTGLNPQPIGSQFTRGTAGYQLAVSNFATSCSESESSDPTGLNLPQDLNVPGQQFGAGITIGAFYMPPIPSPAVTAPSVRVKGKRNARGSLGNKNKVTSNPIRSDFKTTQGIIQIPIASNIQNSSPGGGNPGSQNSPPSCVNIQLFQPTSKKITKWSVERIGALPEIPDPTVPQSYKNNYTILANNISTNGIEIMADGYTPIFRASGEYSYSLLTAVQLNDTLPFDIPTWVNFTASSTTQIIPSDFESGIINNPIS
jgi:hypothetical protein